MLPIHAAGANALAEALKRIRENLLRIVAALALLPLGWLLVHLIGRDPIQVREVLMVAGSLLIVAFVAQYTEELLDLLERLTKAGPFELAEREPKFRLEGKQRLGEGFSRPQQRMKSVSTVGDVGDREYRFDENERILHAEDLYQYERWDLYVSFRELHGFKPRRAVKDRELHELLLEVGRAAMLLQDWPRAIGRLELLLEISEASYKPAKTYYYCGTSYLWRSLEGQGAEEETKAWLKKAAECLGFAADLDKLDHMPSFQLGVALDELGACFRAVESNDEALARKHDYAPAKYNGVISLIKLKKWERAYQRLASILPADEVAHETIQFAWTDPELKPLLTDKKWGPETKRFLKTLG